jgi:hypothetical protein
MDRIPALVALPDIAAQEELTIGSALFPGSGFARACRCPAAADRGVVRGTDWTRAGLQARYRGWFSWWLQQKITQTHGHPSRWTPMKDARRPPQQRPYAIGNPVAPDPKPDHAQRAGLLPRPVHK